MTWTCIRRADGGLGSLRLQQQPCHAMPFDATQRGGPGAHCCMEQSGWTDPCACCLPCRETCRTRGPAGTFCKGRGKAANNDRPPQPTREMLPPATAILACRMECTARPRSRAVHAGASSCTRPGPGHDAAARSGLHPRASQLRLHLPVIAPDKVVGRRGLAAGAVPLHCHLHVPAQRARTAGGGGQQRQHTQAGPPRTRGTMVRHAGGVRDAGTTAQQAWATSIR